MPDADDMARAFGSTVGETLKAASGLNLPMDALAQVQGEYLKHATDLWNVSLQRMQDSDAADAGKDSQQGHVSQTDETVFAVGRNVATTEGSVVFENELIQLIEYKPLTPQVHERPMLIVPPCINKFYILDLQPENSLVRYTVEQGHRVFVVSWRNADESMAQL